MFADLDAVTGADVLGMVELRTENRVAVPVPASMPATKGSPPPVAPVVDDRKAGSRLIVLS